MDFNNKDNLPQKGFTSKQEATIKPKRPELLSVQDSFLF